MTIANYLMLRQGEPCGAIFYAAAMWMDATVAGRLLSISLNARLEMKRAELNERLGRTGAKRPLPAPKDVFDETFSLIEFIEHFESCYRTVCPKQHEWLMAQILLRAKDGQADGHDSQ